MVVISVEITIQTLPGKVILILSETCRISTVKRYYKLVSLEIKLYVPEICLGIEGIETNMKVALNCFAFLLD